MRVLMMVINPMTADSRVEKEASTLAAAGHDVTVLARLDDGLPAREQRDGYRILRVRYQRVLKERALAARDRVAAGGGPARAASLARFAARGALVRTARTRTLPYDYWHGTVAHVAATVEPCEVVHAHDLGTLRAALRLAEAWTPRLGRRPRVVYDSHELFVEQYVPKWRSYEKAAWRLHERRWIGAADLVITVSDEIAAELRRRYHLRETPTVLLNTPRVLPPPAAPGDRPGSDVRRDAGLGPDEPLVVYAGGVKPGRGVDVLVEALPRSAAGWHLALVGPGAHPHVAQLIDRADELGVAARLHLIPSQPAASLPTYLATADLGVHPLPPSVENHRLALPNKLFDYLFAGLPVAVPGGTSMARLVARHDAGTTFDPADPAGVAAALDRAVTGAAPLPAGTVAELRDCYGWHVMAERLLAAYARLA